MTALEIALGDARIPPRIWDKITVDADGCWIWTGTYASAPQTRWKIDGQQKTVNVRRVFYLVTHGGPPPLNAFGGCKSHCVNPAHVKNARSQDLSKEWFEQSSKRTHCKNGHEFAVVGAYEYEANRSDRKPKRYRVCRLCHALRMKATAAKKRRRRLARMSPARRQRFLMLSKRQAEIWRAGKRRTHDGQLSVRHEEAI